MKQSSRSRRIASLLSAALMVGVLLIAPLSGTAAVSCGTSIAPSQAAADHTISQAYVAWIKAYVTANGAGGQLRVQRSAADKNDTVSEGIGYGMLFAVAQNDPTTFAALWNYEQAHLDADGLMNWDINSSNVTVGYNAATDADEDMALALVMADKAWGGYQAAATTQIKLIRQYEVEAGSYSVKPGDVWGGSNLLNPSYFAPGYYSVFAAYSGDDSWNKVITAGYQVLTNIRNNTAAGTTGFVPDWSTSSGAPVNGMSYAYSYDASREPVRLALSSQWQCDSDSLANLTPLTNQFQSVGLANVASGYHLDGSTDSSGQSNLPLLADAVDASTVATDSSYRTAAWNALASAPTDSYFPDSLRLFGLLVASGDLHDPTVSPAAVPSNPLPAANAVVSNTSVAPVTASYRALPTASLAHPASLDIWWPTSGQQLNGLQPFKVMLEDNRIDDYTVYWQVDGGQLNLLSSSYLDYPHKQADVDVSGWKWRGEGPYQLTFTAKAADGTVLGKATTAITVVQ